MNDNTVAPAPATDIALLPPSQRAVIVLDSTKAEAQLRELVALSADITAVIDKPGRDQAHRAGMALKNARVAITKIGKDARADARAFADAVVAEEQRLVGIAQPEEDRIFGLRDGYDAKIAAEKAEAERKEQDRVNGIKAMIASIGRLAIDVTGAPAAEIAVEILALEGFKAGAEFAEFADEADTVARGTLATLRSMHERQVAVEAEAARVAAERAELARLRAEADERDRLAAEQRARDEATAAELRAAQEKELAAQREALEADRREQEAKAAALEADRAAFQRHQEEAQRAAEAKAAAELPTVSGKEVISSDGTFYDHEKIKENGDPTMRNADGSRSIFCDVDEGDEPVAPAADLPPDEADEAAEAALRARVECLNLAVTDLLVMGCTADHVLELVELAITAAGQKVAA